MAVLTAACTDVVVLELPETAHLVDQEPAVPRQSVVFDRDGNELAVLRSQHREPVSLGAVPKHVVDAVLTAEDRRFFDHRGVDLRSLSRAALVNIASGEVEQGGSTITQQLVKTLYMPQAPRTPETKLQEAILARQLEEQRSKASILEDYLNSVYFGQGAYGIEAAAHSYFRTTVAELELHEAAMLAAILRAPEALSPAREPDAVKRRRDDVLWRMAEDGYISVQQRRDATSQPIEVHPRPVPSSVREPHVVDFVLRTLLADPRLGPTEEARAQRLYQGGLRIHTTIDPRLQAAARSALRSHLDADGPDGAIAAVDPSTGHVRAMVGSRSYDELQFDLATQARRQPGSTFKAFVLAAAIADGWQPDDLLDGSQGDIAVPGGVWEDVRNYDRRSYGAISIQGATRVSINTAFVRLAVEVGLDRVAAMARALGVDAPVPTDEPQIAIGGGRLGVTPLDMAAAFATLANGGVHVPTTVVSHIEDEHGQLVWAAETRGSQALTPSQAWVTTHVLIDAVERGTGVRARVDRWPVAGKTGTTSDHADAWFVGTTPVLSTAVWLGHVEGLVPMLDVQGLARVTGGSIPADVFATFMTAALRGQSPQQFPVPDEEHVVVEIDPETGLRAAPWCRGELQRLPRVMVPDDTCPLPPGGFELPSEDDSDQSGGDTIDQEMTNGAEEDDFPSDEDG